MNDKVRENRVRRMATRQGLVIEKSRRRDPNAIDFGGYMLVDGNTSAVILGGGRFAFSANLDEIEKYLSCPPKKQRKRS